jgi:hypothetical protein
MLSLPTDATPPPPAVCKNIKRKDLQIGQLLILKGHDELQRDAIAGNAAEKEKAAERLPLSKVPALVYEIDGSRLAKDFNGTLGQFQYRDGNPGLYAHLRASPTIL